MDFPAGVMVKLCCVIMGGGTMNDGDFSFDVMEAALRLVEVSSLSNTILAVLD